MGPSIIRKLLSAVLTSVFAFGIMVVILDEGPVEMPYYDSAWQEPVNSPRLDAVYYADDNVEPSISTLPQSYSSDAAAVNEQEYNGTVGTTH
ncbi:MAG: hypothetical protein ABH871_06655 [Pseudomonadota bacterium]